jgi:hypothetical protein
MAARSIRISPTNPAFRKFWQSLAEMESAGQPIEAEGRTWNALTLRAGTSTAFYLHRDELGPLAQVLGKDYAETPEWLNLPEVGRLMGMGAESSSPLGRAWEAMQDAFADTGRALFQGRAYRAETRLSADRSAFCIHKGEMAAFARAVKAKDLILPKTAEWLSSREVADILGAINTRPRFTDPWKSLIASVEAGEPPRNGEPVRFEFRKSYKPCWCLHRDEVEWFSAYANLRPRALENEGSLPDGVSAATTADGEDEIARGGFAP